MTMKAWPVVLADVVDRDDVRVVGDARGGSRLALEAARGRGVRGEARREHLDRDEAAEQLVLGSPDRRHPAVGDVADDAVAIRAARYVPGSRAALSGGYPSHLTATLRRRMAKVCHSCGKGPAFGHSRSHSMVATKRRFEPNLQKVRIMSTGPPGASTSARAASRPARSRRPSDPPCLGSPRRPPACRDPSLVRFRTVVEGALAHLESRREEINDLNVFPVADGDTGDNMALTLRAVLERARPARQRGGRTLDEIGREEIVESVARAALLGARGNSGVILCSSFAARPRS